MTIPQMMHALHRDRLRRTSSWSYSAQAVAGGKHETIHSLTPDRYLVVTCDSVPVKMTTGSGASFSTNEDRLHSWKLQQGAAPREDVFFGRYVTVLGMRVRY